MHCFPEVVGFHEKEPVVVKRFLCDALLSELCQRFKNNPAGLPWVWYDIDEMPRQKRKIQPFLDGDRLLPGEVTSFNSPCSGSRRSPSRSTLMIVVVTDGASFPSRKSSMS